MALHTNLFISFGIFLIYKCIFISYKQSYFFWKRIDDFVYIFGTCGISFLLSFVLFLSSTSTCPSSFKLMFPLKNNHSDKTSIIQKYLYLEIDVDDVDAIGNEPIYHNDEIVGVITSGGYGHRVNKSLAFGYVHSSLAKENNEFDVQILGKKRKAIHLSKMAYDSDNLKLKS